MQFFGVGPAELIVILVVALIFVGPERLPRLAADLARMIREVRQYTGGLAQEFNEVVKDLETETAGERSQWKEIGEGLTGATKSVTEAIRAARADAEDPVNPTTATKSPTPPGPLPPSDPTRDAGAGAARWVDVPEPGASGVRANGTGAAANTAADDAR